MSFSTKTQACTGISLHTREGFRIIGRTMEWGTFKLESHLLIVPRGYTRKATTPTGNNGIELKAKYGYAGIGVLEENFIAEGINEKGVVVELFYFPGYGEYEEYNPEKNTKAITDAQFLDWVLCNFSSIAEMEKELGNIHYITYGKGFESAHYSIADATGRQVVVEYFDGKFHVFENRIGVITNAPSFDWHMTNLNNYVNIFAGMVPERKIMTGITLKSFGMGSASLGLPGDLTPPSRFVRAAFYIHSAPKQKNGPMAVRQLFQILNNFDIPIGSEFKANEGTPDMLSATQWTTAIDIKNMKFYYRTAWNYTVRCIDLNDIDFCKVKYQTLPLDKREFPVEYIKIK